MAQSQAILVTVVGSSGNTPKQFTAASPSFNNYPMVSTFIDFGDSTFQSPAGITASGYINVQYHSNNQWVTGTLYVTSTGAQIKTLVDG